MEVPEQYQAIKRLGLLRETRKVPAFKEPPMPCNPPDCPSVEDPWYGLPEGWDAYLDPKSSRIVYVNFALNTQTYVRPTFAKTDAHRNSLSSESTASTTSSGGHSRSTRSSASLSRYHARPALSIPFQ